MPKLSGRMSYSVWALGLGVRTAAVAKARMCLAGGGKTRKVAVR